MANHNLVADAMRRPVDALSQILRSVQLSGAFFVSARFTAPWCYQSPKASVAAPLLEPGAEEVVIFHLVTSGQCVVEVAGQAPVSARAGDVLLLPRGSAHRMASEPGLKPPGGINLRRLLACRPRRLAYGGGGTATAVVCGYLGCDRRLAALLLKGLPPIVKVHLREQAAASWLEASVQYALAESQMPRPGSAGIQAKLAELLFIEVLRQYAHEHSGQAGWLAGLEDRIVGKVLDVLHGNPSHDWTLEGLARASGTSRTVLAERFQAIVGTTPMQYLTQWRMVLAANLLRGSDMPLARIAEQIGYRNDTSFSRAFRREYGHPPAAWRRSRSFSKTKQVEKSIS